MFGLFQRTQLIIIRSLWLYIKVVIFRDPQSAASSGEYFCGHSLCPPTVVVTHHCDVQLLSQFHTVAVAPSPKWNSLKSGSGYQFRALLCVQPNTRLKDSKWELPTDRTTTGVYAPVTIIVNQKVTCISKCASLSHMNVTTRYSIRFLLRNRP